MINFYLKNRLNFFIEIKRKMKRKIFRRVESHYLLKSVKNTGQFGNSTFPNACGEALLAKREFISRAEGECRNEFR